MPNLFMTIGIIGSGKSTFTKLFVKGTNIKIVSGDDLRNMFHGYYLYNIDFEEKIINEAIIRNSILLFERGYDVIIDECNLTRKIRQNIANNLNKYYNKCYGLVFNIKDKKWHIKNRCKILREYTKKEWENIFDEQINLYECVDKQIEKYFDKIIDCF